MKTSTERFCFQYMCTCMYMYVCVCSHSSFLWNCWLS